MVAAFGLTILGPAAALADEITLTPSSTKLVHPMLGNTINPAGSYLLSSTTPLVHYTLNKIEVGLHKMNNAGGWDVWPIGAGLKGCMANNGVYSSTPYQQLPAGTYSLSHRMYYNKITMTGTGGMFVEPGTKGSSEVPLAFP
jgi:hypothetical protein